MQGEQWEEAYLAQSQDAAIGRLFRGIVHNLSGVVQVFSLHSELLGMTMDKAMTLLAQMRDEQGVAQADALLTLIGQRASGLAQLRDKVDEARKLLERTLVLPDFHQLSPEGAETIKRLVETEVAFLCADSFFKHKVEKRLELEAGTQVLARGQLALHQLVHLLLCNALDAVREAESPRVNIFVEGEKDGVRVVIEDNGPGVTPEVMARMYEPFFSTREGHLGLGLYLGQRLVEQLAGELSCESQAGRTIFTVVIPLRSVQA